MQSTAEKSWSNSRLVQSNFAFLVTMAVSLPASGADITFPKDATSIKNLKTDFGAVGDGVTDDSNALIAAMNYMVSQRDHGGYATYIPRGNYRITKTIVYSGPRRENPGHYTNELSDTMRFIGQSRDGVVLKLDDNCPGYGDPEHPKPVLSFGKSPWGANNNRVSGNMLKHLTVDIGAGNGGAVGVVFHGANNATVRDVHIRSSDSSKAGHIGFLDPWGAAHGYFEGITIDGFNVGIEYLVGLVSATAWEHVVLRDQATTGIRLGPGSMAIRDLTSIQSNPDVPAITMNHDRGQILLLDGRLYGSGPAAIEMQRCGGRCGHFWGRNVAINGYRSGVAEDEEVLVPGDITEFSSHVIESLFEFPNAPRPRLAVQETPAVSWEADLENWVDVKSYGAAGDGQSDDTAAIQKAMNSGKPVVYFPEGTFQICRPISIPASVRQVRFLFCGLRTTLTSEHDGLFVIDEESPEAILLEGLYLFKVELAEGDVYLVKHASKRTLVLRDVHWQGGGRIYFNTVPGGILFLENVSGRVAGGRPTPNFRFRGQTVFARFLDPEYGRPYVAVDNSTFWLLGMKGEKARIAFEIQNRSKAELLGFVQSNFSSHVPPDLPVIINDQSDVLAFGYTDGRSEEGRYHKTIVRETQGSESKTLLWKGLPARVNQQDTRAGVENHPWIAYESR